MPTGIYKRKPISEKTREKLRIINSGKNNPMYGKTTSKLQKETVRRLSLGNKHRLGKEPYNKGTHLSGMLGKKHTDATINKMSEVKKGKPLPWMKEEKHPEWKGGEVGYRALHSWVKRKLGQPDKCEDCGVSKLEGRQIHWANISGLYKRLITDWRRLCAKCHGKFDKIHGLRPRKSGLKLA